MNYFRNAQHRNYAILEKKIQLLENAYYRLCLTGKVVNQYDEGWQNEKEKFSAYFDRIMAGIASQVSEASDLPYEICLLNIDQKPSASLDILKRLSSPDYSPPTELIEILNDLRNLWAYWVNCRPTKTYALCPPPGVSEDGLELALATLMRVVGNWENLVFTHMDREISRTCTSTKTKREKAEEGWKTFVLAMYKHGETIPPGTRLSKAIEIIQRQFTESLGNDKAPWGAVPKNMRTPSRDSIIDLLTIKGILTKDFKKLGRYWFKKM